VMVLCKSLIDRDFTPPIGAIDAGLGVGGEVGLRDFNGGNRGKGDSYYLRVTHVVSVV